MAGDYQIRTKFLTTALQQLGLVLQEDMFATKKNAKCKIYYSPTQEDTAAGTGGLQAIWSNKVVFLNPPLILMGQVVQKQHIVSNCTAVVIAIIIDSNSVLIPILFYSRLQLESQFISFSFVAEAKCS
ncbi:MAG: hypothetical protein EZS28_043161 [Streblomastix strix]|uniref:Uncharacterized protein n=1 Tax=Streblomastix strix TaxID=222440 RepID=A0A5J4TTP0_9EUKA|nr:MAG: hypothetical protein EZS28_043161 [Streblomastix strix]